MHIRLTRAPGRLAALVASGIATGGLLTMAATAPAMASTEPSAHITSVSGVTVTAFHVTSISVGNESHHHGGGYGYGGGYGEGDHGGYGYGDDDHGGYGDHGGWGYGDHDHGGWGWEHHGYHHHGW